MQNDFRYVIGLMSGTSLDGLDIVYVRFNKNNQFEIIYADTFSYSNKWKTDLQNAIHFSFEELEELDVSFGSLLGEKINLFIEKNKIKEIDFIASHGHTVLHQPEKRITLQIGNGQEIATITNKEVVCDFRTQDVNLGGQGAPLVPIGDELLFSEYDYCLNLGGFANISFRKNNERIAFDICPVNIVLNHYCRKLDLEFDNEGEIASKGKINQELLEALNSLDFYRKAPPKSLGLEWVQSTVFPLIDDLDRDVSSVLRTFVEHSAYQISQVIKKDKSVLVTGGGVFNSFLMSRIENLSEGRIITPSKKIIEFKEALIFAFLGLLRVDNQVNCLKSVTGARKNHSSGKIFHP